MSYNLQTIIDIVNFISNKEQSGKTLTSANINTIFTEINIECFNVLYNNFEKSIRYKDSLLPFLKVMGKAGEAPMKINNIGTAELPKDYYHSISGGIVYYLIDNNNDNEHCKRLNSKLSKVRKRPVEIIAENTYASRLGDELLMPTKEYPVCIFKNNYIQFFPEDLQSVEFNYYREPVNPVYVTTPDDISLVETYDSANSINFEYNHFDYPLLIALFCINIGINLGRKELIEIAQTKMQTL